MSLYRKLLGLLLSRSLAMDKRSIMLSLPCSLVRLFLVLQAHKVSTGTSKLGIFEVLSLSCLNFP